MDWLISDALPVLAKIFIVSIFPFSFLDKVLNWDNALKQANSGFLPGGDTVVGVDQWSTVHLWDRTTGARSEVELAPLAGEDTDKRLPMGCVRMERRS